MARSTEELLKDLRLYAEKKDSNLIREAIDAIEALNAELLVTKWSQSKPDTKFAQYDAFKAAVKQVELDRVKLINYLDETSETARAVKTLKSKPSKKALAFYNKLKGIRS